MLKEDKLVLDKLIEKMGNVESVEKKLYSLGIQVQQKLPKLMKTVTKKNKDYLYLEWIAYEYILQAIDPNHFWWISYADEYRVEVTMTWFDKEYKGSYGVKQVAVSKTTGKPIKSISEQVVDDGMRCYAKLSSRVTQFMKHLWLEGGSF